MSSSWTARSWKWDRASKCVCFPGSNELPQYRIGKPDPGRELTVICGNNGQGKTNLLEAIWLLTGGKSFRGGKDAELVRAGEPFAVLEAVHAPGTAGGTGA